MQVQKYIPTCSRKSKSNPMNRFAKLNTTSKLSKTVPSPNPSFTKLAGARHTPSVVKVEDFAHGSNLRSLVGAGMGKVFDLDGSGWFHHGK